MQFWGRKGAILGEKGAKLGIGHEVSNAPKVIDGDITCLDGVKHVCLGTWYDPKSREYLDI